MKTTPFEMVFIIRDDMRRKDETRKDATTDEYRRHRI